MDKKEIEKAIDSEFPDGFEKYVTIENIKSFLFDTILPEVLRDILPEVKNEFSIENTICNYIEEKAKEKYNITL